MIKGAFSAAFLFLTPPQIFDNACCIPRGALALSPFAPHTALIGAPPSPFADLAFFPPSDRRRDDSLTIQYTILLLL